MSIDGRFIEISLDLDQAGLIWHPEIGDEVSERVSLDRVSILVDPQGLTPGELRSSYIWLPTLEQIVQQFEAREAMIYHVGVNQSFAYEAVIRTKEGLIETQAHNLRVAFGEALRELLVDDVPTGLLQ